MPDPRLSLTAQDLIYAARGLRGLAIESEREARDPQMESCRALFERAARRYGELAGKCERIAESVARRGQT